LLGNFYHILHVRLARTDSGGDATQVTS